MDLHAFLAALNLASLSMGMHLVGAKIGPKYLAASFKLPSSSCINCLNRLYAWTAPCSLYAGTTTCLVVFWANRPCCNNLLSVPLLILSAFPVSSAAFELSGCTFLKSSTYVVNVRSTPPPFTGPVANICVYSCLFHSKT